MYSHPARHPLSIIYCSLLSSTYLDTLFVLLSVVTYIILYNNLCVLPMIDEQNISNNWKKCAKSSYRSGVVYKRAYGHALSPMYNTKFLYVYTVFDRKTNRQAKHR